ncbi:22160_t:CDS:2, partial [Gigaspora margarita]
KSNRKQCKNEKKKNSPSQEKRRKDSKDPPPENDAKMVMVRHAEVINVDVERIKGSEIIVDVRVNAEMIKLMPAQNSLLTSSSCRTRVLNLGTTCVRTTFLIKARHPETNLERAAVLGGGPHRCLTRPVQTNTKELDQCLNNRFFNNSDTLKYKNNSTATTISITSRYGDSNADSEARNWSNDDKVLKNTITKKK